MNRDVQMVISTHSPELIDSELVLPSQVLCCARRTGETDGEAAVGVERPAHQSRG